MNRVTATILSLALAASGAFGADPPGEKPKEKSPAEVLYEKLLAENTKEADKQYGEYLAALAKANEAIIKKLEIAKADLNNPKKGNLSITERAAAIAEIDAKILEVKKNGVGEAVVAKAGRSGDLLGEKTVVVWKIENNKEYTGNILTLMPNGTFTVNHPLKGNLKGKWEHTLLNDVKYLFITYEDGWYIKVNTVTMVGEDKMGRSITLQK